MKGASVLVLGLTFKENVPDIRNTKIVDIVKEFREYGINVTVCDPVAEQDEVEHEYGFRLTDMDKLGRYDAVVLGVGHDAFKGMKIGDYKARLAPGRRILADVKGILDKEEVLKQGLVYWRL